MESYRKPSGQVPSARRTRSWPWVLGLAVLVSGSAHAASSVPNKIAPALTRLAATHPDESVVAWVYFTDRAGAERDIAAAHRGRPLVSERSLERRLRRGRTRGLDVRDLPVHGPYVRALGARGARVRGTSRWLDAASVEIRAGLLEEIARLPFVGRIEPVMLGRRITEPTPTRIIAYPAPRPHGSLAGGPQPGEQAYYGGSFNQLNMMQVPAMHALGLTGAGVLVCMLDTGYETNHVALTGLDVVATRDFIYRDSVVANEPEDPFGQSGHGTTTLGVLAGSSPGAYSGPAFGASLALGKTESIVVETPVEMDLWQFGAEWADSLGADIISSSVGYSEFQAPFESYTYADMDGHTTVITLAALEAMNRGITVVNCAGNEAEEPWHYIIAPADADTLIAVGAVDNANKVTKFSSRGPTADGRIKPDVMALGKGVLIVYASNLYIQGEGTSYSAPLVAGVAALLLEAHPTWGPFEVREALRVTATNHAAPNNNIGWGLVQGMAALGWGPAAVPRFDPDGPGIALAAGPNPVERGRATMLRFAAPGAGAVTVDAYDATGRRRARLFAGSADSERAVRWEARDDAGAPLPPGIYWVRLQAPMARGAQRSASVRVVVLS